VIYHAIYMGNPTQKKRKSKSLKMIGSERGAFLIPQALC
jgi:hypothetical protein